MANGLAPTQQTPVTQPVQTQQPVQTPSTSTSGSLAKRIGIYAIISALGTLAGVAVQFLRGISDKAGLAIGGTAGAVAGLALAFFVQRKAPEASVKPAESQAKAEDAAKPAESQAKAEDTAKSAEDAAKN